MEKSSYEKKSKIVFYIYITQIIQSFLIVYSSILNVFNIILIVIFFSLFIHYRLHLSNFFILIDFSCQDTFYCLFIDFYVYFLNYLLRF